MSGTLSVLLKIVFSGVLVGIGYGVTGALIGVFIAVIGGWLITCGPVYRAVIAGKGKQFHSLHLTILPSLPVLVANIAFAIMTQIDIVLVNYYFSPHDAGLYAAASVLGKAVMYLPGGLALAMFPMVAENHARNEESTHLLIQALLMAAFMCGCGAFFYYFFSDWIIRFFYGESYKGAGEVLRYYGFAILPMALIMVAEYFLIAKGRVIFAYLFLLFAPMQLLAVYYFHSTLLSIVAILAVTGGLLSCVGFGLLWQSFRTSKNISTPQL
jgi:O-antigen/teichoic acid export membrane protein